MASVWHVNQDTTVYADFTQINDAIADPEVVDGIHFTYMAILPAIHLQ